MNLARLLAPCALALPLAACTNGGEDSARDSSVYHTGSDWIGSRGCPPNDPSGGFPEPAPCITDVLNDCGLTTPNTWTTTVRVAGWAAGATLSIYQTAAWKEGDTETNANAWTELGHEFSQSEEPGVDYDQNGEWDQWHVVLTVTDQVTEVAPGTKLTTLFGCELYDEAVGSKDLAWRLYIYDDDDNDRDTPGVAADCWDYGFQPEEIPLMHEADELCTIEE